MNPEKTTSHPQCCISHLCVGIELVTLVMVDTDSKLDVNTTTMQ